MPLAFFADHREAPSEISEENSNRERIEYCALELEILAEQTIYLMNRPWGVSIGDITVRASGDAYIL